MRYTEIIVLSLNMNTFISNKNDLLHTVFFFRHYFAFTHNVYTYRIFDVFVVYLFILFSFYFFAAFSEMVKWLFLIAFWSNQLYSNIALHTHYTVANLVYFRFKVCMLAENNCDFIHSIHVCKNNIQSI